MPLQQPPRAAASIKEPKARAIDIAPSSPSCWVRWLDTDHVAVGTLYLAAARHVVRIGFPHFRLPHQEEVGVVARQPLIERRRQTLSRTRRLNEMRRDDDDQIGLMLLIVHAAEQSAENWNGSQPGNL